VKNVSLTLIQIALLVLWFTVPAFAAVPWWIIFMPAFILVVFIIVVVSLYAIAGAIAYQALR
jgi:hypothetical protein